MFAMAGSSKALNFKNCVMPVIGTLCLIAVVSPVFLAWVLPLVVLYLALMRYSAPATRDLQRLEATSRSPIFSQFSETLAGLTTIRAFGAAPRFAAHSKTLVDANTRCFYTQYVQSQWVSYRLDLLGSSIIFLAALLPVAMSQLAFRINVALAGVAISYALEVCNFLKHATRMTLELEKTFSGVERIMEYADTVPQDC